MSTAAPDRIFGPESVDGPAPSTAMLHGTTVALGTTAALIVGESGTGKSSLALQLLAFGAALVSDDQTSVTRRDDTLLASAPPAIAGRIEARGIGLLVAETVSGVPIRLVIDMDTVEKDRLPPLYHCRILGVRLPLVHRVDAAHFPAAILQYLRGGRSA